MAPAPQFQLFPPVQTLNRPNGNPFRKDHRRRRSGKSPSVSPVSPSVSPIVEGIKLGQTEAVLLQIIEDTNAIAPPRPVSVDGGESPTTVATVNQQSEGSKSPSESRKTASPPPLQPVKPALICDTNLHRPFSSPIVPMQSIFPRYDPTVPLGHQRYFPQRSAGYDLPREVISRAEYLPSVTSPAEDPPSGPAVPQLASAKELERLWEATKGEEPQTDLGTFRLRVSRCVYTSFLSLDSL